MMKVKHERTADCVVGGFRWHKAGGGVGSLLLGLFDEAGVLHHVGVASGFSVARREEFVDVLEPYRSGRRRRVIPGSAEGAPGGRVSPGARAAGARARTSAGSRCGPNSWSRWPTTTSRSTGSATPPLSFAGGRTGPRHRAPTAQLDTPVPTELG